MLLSDPCVHRGTSTARLPPGSLPPLTLRCFHSHQLLSYVWPSLLLNLTKECHPGFLIFIFYFFEHYNILRFALMFFFLLNCERTRKKPFSEVSWATSKLLHAHLSGSGARERCLPHFLTAKTSHASERQPPTPHRLH